MFRVQGCCYPIFLLLPCLPLLCSPPSYCQSSFWPALSMGSASHRQSRGRCCSLLFSPILCIELGQTFWVRVSIWGTSCRHYSCRPSPSLSLAITAPFQLGYSLLLARVRVLSRLCGLRLVHEPLCCRPPPLSSSLANVQWFPPFSFSLVVGLGFQGFGVWGRWKGWRDQVWRGRWKWKGLGWEVPE